MADFLKNNQHVFVLILLLLTIALIVMAYLNHMKTSKLVKSMLVNKFKVVDMNEKSTTDNSTLYTVIISNNSMNAISIASLGFEHNGNYFNFRNECKAQVESNQHDLVILPRGSIKLRLFQEQLEGTIFKTVVDKKLKKISVYVIGMGGENCRLKAKVVTKKMKENFKQYYSINKPEIMAKFVATCDKKLSLGLKLKFFEKLRYNSWKKKITGELPEVELPDWDKAAIPAPESEKALPNILNSAEIDNPRPEDVNDVSKKSDKAEKAEQAKETVAKEAEAKEKTEEINANEQKTKDAILEKTENNKQGNSNNK